MMSHKTVCNRSRQISQIAKARSKRASKNPLKLQQLDATFVNSSKRCPSKLRSEDTEDPFSEIM